ncbi:MAG: FtsX-like permease family protein [Clostridiaceae bacterium]|nr:FtsX-like permease family protein [Clostridiaceae bacterium]
MMLCLLGGFVIVIAMVSSVPIYTDGILQFMLTRDMKDYQTTTSKYPGRYELNMSVSYVEGSRVDVYRFFQQKLDEELLPLTADIPLVAENRTLTAMNMQSVAADEAQRSSDRIFTNVMSMANLPEHVKVLTGRMYEPGINANGCYEVVISQTALANLGLQLNVPYYISMLTEKEPSIKYEIVGVVEQSDYADPYWYTGLGAYGKHVLMDEQTFIDVYMGDGLGRALTNVTWFLAFDYYQITVEGLPGFLQGIDAQKDFYEQYKNYVKLNMPIYDTLKEYSIRSSQLQNTLLVILVPLLVMLALYIFMVSQLIIKNDENEISLLRSRGASSYQIFLIYLFEGFVVGALALVIGPLLGYGLCRVVGASNGFLEFVQRTALPLKLSKAAYFYSAVAVVLFLVTMLIPAYSASRTTIVERKRKKSRFGDQPLWKRFFLDFVTLTVSVYGFTQYERVNTLIVQSGTSTTELNIDPLLFLISSLFILGCGLFFLRIYPYLVRLVFFIGKRRWSPTMYASLVQVGRSSGQEQFLMLFIILSVAVGIFNANSARTLNRNIEDKIYYNAGADVIVEPYWPNNADDIEEELAVNPNASKVVTYIEPPFEPYENIDGIDHAAKVFTTDTGVARATVATAGSIKQVKIMGIEPSEFGQVAWFRNDLLPYHWYNYLNLMVDAPKAALVSTSLRDQLGLAVGDPIYITWGSQQAVECTVYAFVDYWPTYDPDRFNGCVVVNLNFIQTTLAKEPYQVWMKKSDTGTDVQISQSLADAKIGVEDITYTNQSLIEVKNDPLLQGLNGMLTLSFIITMLVTAIGFLIYWTLSIRSRALQFGIFRAMGMSLGRVLGIIISEQVMISVVSIAVGIILGGVTSEMFVPMMQLVYSASQQVPPFEVVMQRSDYYKIYGVIGFILTAGFFALSRIIASIKIDQALKLGED